MTNLAEILDPMRLPLQGERLIEASAGTGKTYTISVLYLRLLLGLGGRAAFPRPLTVEEILVVTFTEAATEELRGRIRHNIHELRISCLRQTNDNPLYVSLLDEIDDKRQAAQWLLLAEQHMNEAAIFTIHGFCKRMLSLNTFESSILFEQQLIEDESALRYQACADFWRRHCYPLSREIAKEVYAQWKGPAELLRAIDRYLQGEIPVIKSPLPADETLATRHQRIIALIDGLKQRWRYFSGDIESIIENSAIDRRKFNRVNQSKWMKEISSWAQEETRSYSLPDSLEKFSQRFLVQRTKDNGAAPEHPIFKEIEELLAQPLTLDDLFISQALAEIRDTIACKKRRSGELGFDDMLSRMDVALASENGDKLASFIRTRFPVVMIDEFQDTDSQQYRIFCRIWRQQPNTALLLIGDPKQAIYAFRGADIFTYMKARCEVQAHYTLDINWRSSPGMVDSVNSLFKQIDKPFIFQEIPFLPVKSTAKNAGLRFEYHGETIPAMRLWLMEGEGCSVDEYQAYMARQCAEQICDWISAGLCGKALLWSGKAPRPVKASDITVLVRSRYEAAQIRDALTLFNIPSVCVANHNSVFETLEAQEILWLLRAVLSPEWKTTLRCALASSMFGLNARDIDALNNSERTWYKVVEEFNEYRELWQRCGVMAMLRELMISRHIAENMLVTPGGERRLTNIMHIGELLQEAGSRLDSEHALARWLEKHISDPNSNIASQQMRLESDKHLVQIITIHKSKGLEYPLVWLPFIANYRVQDQDLTFYHDRASFEAVLDLSRNDESGKLAELERLAEDLRLLYVALTRSIWHCSLGIAPLRRRRRGEKACDSDLHHSALGCLIQQGEPKDAAGLRQCLQSLCNEHISLCIPTFHDNTIRRRCCWQMPQQQEASMLKLQARRIQRVITDNWRVTSYSALQQQHQEQRKMIDFMPKLDAAAVGTGVVLQQQTALTPHQFPRGVLPGTFLHSLFETLDFTKPVSDTWVQEMLQKGGYEAHWQQAIVSWITAVLHAPLTENAFTLYQIDTRSKLVEMEFYLPIEKTLTAEVLDTTIRRYDPLSRQCAPLDFRQVRGMMTGFIDLVFRYDGRYYLLDYKANWLGENSEAYTRQAMLQTMQMHRYDLQYQFYTLALHRYLRHRLADYEYETYFGGVIYLFLRGIDINNPQSGIFTARPAAALINELDRLFAGSVEEEMS